MVGRKWKLNGDLLADQDGSNSGVGDSTFLGQWRHELVKLIFKPLATLPTSSPLFALPYSSPLHSPSLALGTYITTRKEALPFAHTIVIPPTVEKYSVWAHTYLGEIKMAGHRNQAFWPHHACLGKKQVKGRKTGWWVHQRRRLMTAA